MKNTIAIIILLGCCWSLPSLIHAQVKQRPYRFYATQEVMQRIWKENPALNKITSSNEQLNTDFKIKGSAKKVTVPVVFHFLYTPGKDEYLEKEIYAQLDALNRDFNTQQFPKEKNQAFTEEKFFEKVAKTEIEFCLAEGKKKEAGIIWKPSSVATWSTNDAMKSSKTSGDDPWDTKECLNVWVCHLTNGVSGYAQMPGGPDATDGIVIDFNFFGFVKYAKAPYTQGKTLTHLVGSYLGLHELWNENQPCADDYVHDTPIHNAPNYGNPGYPHISMCSGQVVEMTMNFMDNTDDYAQYMFTLGQKIRMQGVFAKDAPREGITKSKIKCYDPSKKAVQSLDIGTLNDFPNDVIKGKLSVALFPNPADQTFNIVVQNPELGKLLLTVYNTNGQLMQQQITEIGAGSHQFNFNSGKWPAGIYLVHTVINSQSDIQRLVIVKP